jgi:hypothetical protein
MPEPLEPDGSFGAFDGGVSGPRAAWFRGVYGSPTGNSCHGRLTWHFHPAHRRPVQDGTWMLHLSDGERESFRVSVGGRLATGIGLPPQCTLGGVDLFIGTDGMAANSDVGIVLHFSRTTATGTLTIQGCAHPHFTLTAFRTT